MGKIEKTIKRIGPVDKKLMEEAQKRLDNLTKPQGSLGRLEELAKKVVGITGKKNPSLRNKVIFTMVGDHGVVEEGVSAFPQEVTPQMVYNFIKGGAGINVLARHIGARVIVVDMGVKSDIRYPPRNCETISGTESRKSFGFLGEKSDIRNFKVKKIGYGTKNMAKRSAMTREEAIKSIEAGIEVFEEEYKKGIDILGLGDMGIGNTTPSSAVTAVITGRPIEEVTGRGTGVNDGIFENKIKVIEKAIKLNKPNPKDPIDVLAKVGGFEIGGLAGSFLAAAAHKVPVVTDGFIVTTGALIAFGLEPKIKDYIFASHSSVEVGHKAILERMGLQPLLDLDMRLGEGTGACLGISLIEAGVKILTEMATFGEAEVSEALK
ncbi:nicotinate-nucleotide--dimethylbenzimidazole phosphoribosyltransferase [bacterium]|nr:nicotinate-nucleotide--dimethylbenzimidazole phosphoribosyltransferase [bacterium]